MVLAEISYLWAGFVLDVVCVRESSPFMGTGSWSALQMRLLLK